VIVWDHCAFGAKTLCLIFFASFGVWQGAVADLQIQVEECRVPGRDELCVFRSLLTMYAKLWPEASRGTQITSVGGMYRRYLRKKQYQVSVCVEGVEEQC
jgi:hypothetical protein